MSLYDVLLRHAAQGPIPMHMPGHKRAPGLSPCLDRLGAALDVTEIDGLDDLHDAEGILLEAMEAAAALWGSDRAFFLVNGSTCGLLAGIYALTLPGDEILIARNCHKAVYHALELRCLTAHYLLPPIDPDFGIHGSVRPCDVQEMLDAHPGIRLCVITSPTYEGVLSDVSAIAGICHARGIPLLVDEAHGAHLGLTGDFPTSAVSQGADLVIQSVHKTLPSLTQTAVAHAKNEYASAFARALGIFETSSPSYLLMASIDSCVELLSRDRETLFAQWRARLDSVRRRLDTLTRLRLLPDKPMPPLFFRRDPSKLVISCAGTGISGMQLMELLRDRGIECEMAASAYIIAMTGIGDSDAAMDAFADALLAIDRSLPPVCKSPVPVYPGLPKSVCTIARAVASPSRLCTFNEAGGQVSAGYLWAYPPGIPLLTPGEQIDAARIEALLALRQAGISLRNPHGDPPGMLRVL